MTGWKLFGALSAVVAALAGVAYALGPDPVQALQYAVRVTARTSYILFLLVFTASAVARLAPSGFTRALMRERRYLGLSFAFSMLLHAIALAVYFDLAPHAFWVGRTVATNIPGSIGYVFILALAITSFKAASRLIGPDKWRRLHKTGVWFIAVIFAGSFFTRMSHHFYYVAPGALMVAAMILRAHAHLTRVRRNPA